MRLVQNILRPLHAQRSIDGELKPWVLQPVVTSLPASIGGKSLSAFNDVKSLPAVTDTQSLPALHGVNSVSGLLQMRAWKQQSALSSWVKRATQTPLAKRTGLVRKPLGDWKPILMRTVASRTPPKQARLSLHDVQQAGEPTDAAQNAYRVQHPSVWAAWTLAGQPMHASDEVALSHKHSMRVLCHLCL